MYIGTQTPSPKNMMLRVVLVIFLRRKSYTGSYIQCSLLLAKPSTKKIVQPPPKTTESISPTTTPSRRLVAPADCPIVSRCPLVVPPSCPLVVPACCCIATPHPLVALHFRPPFCAGWLLRCLSTRRPLIVSSRCPLVILLRQLIVALSAIMLLLRHPLVILSRRLVVALPLLALPSRPLVVLAIFVSTSPCLAIERHETPSNAVERRRTPSNAVKRCHRHRTPPPPPPLNTISIIHRRHSCRPSPSNTNANLRPSCRQRCDPCWARWESHGAYEYTSCEETSRCQTACEEISRCRIDQSA